MKKSNPTTQDPLEVIRAVFAEVEWTYEEVAADEEDGVTEFRVVCEEDDLFKSVLAVHEPGLFVLYGASHITIPKTQIPEAYSFLSLVNNALQNGCLMMRTPAPAEISFRTSVSYGHAQGLVPGYIASAVSDLLDGGILLFGAVHGVAAGASAKAAFDSL